MTLNDSRAYGVPLLYRKSLKPSGDAFAVSYDLPVSGQCLDRYGGKVCVGSDAGFVIMTPFEDSTELSRSLPTSFQQKHVYQITAYPSEKSLHKVRFNGRFLVYAALDMTVGVFDHVNGQTIDLDITQTFANDLCLNEDGLVAVVGDDHRLIVTDIITRKRYVQRLQHRPTVVKFHPQNSEQVVVVEGGCIVRILNWQTGKVVYTIYASDHIHDVFVKSDVVFVVTSNSIQHFNLKNLQGGLGETYPNVETIISSTRDSARYLRPTGNQLCGVLGVESVSVYDIQKLQKMVQVDVSLPSNEINDCVVSDLERLVFALCAKKLVLIDINN
ncbi:hypothetical protein BABINDRAFT_169497 [Babjeviella inositovora NRRL Y-12698]|uniref:Cleavage/polyadenylation specificity factor A subunit C-terminal domain-containing protein n=1 Tax=Babjeviella inositovora NRRL Y-12698 TaxID=984486 RepID=A0A1E3QH03_9ASCO|nr:uncharacterized protein BABINDRAFT_169497 [Babjeviella inositovora NRRL Y-12698]ODQ76975.1 hypothetical protein BABINDRAFT_169497 [Babjeviella inositovora NRRL Y-12698]